MTTAAALLALVVLLVLWLDGPHFAYETRHGIKVYFRGGKPWVAADEIERLTAAVLNGFVRAGIAPMRRSGEQIGARRYLGNRVVRVCVTSVLLDKGHVAGTYVKPKRQLVVYSPPLASFPCDVFMYLLAAHVAHENGLGAQILSDERLIRALGGAAKV